MELLGWNYIVLSNVLSVLAQILPGSTRGATFYENCNHNDENVMVKSHRVHENLGVTPSHVAYDTVTRVHGSGTSMDGLSRETT